MKNVIEENMHEYEALCSILEIAVDENHSDKAPNYDDIAPATQHQELDNLEQQSVENHSFSYFYPGRPDY